MPQPSLQSFPLRNESVIGAQVYSHSGEFSPRVEDFIIRARGIDAQFVRKYRSSLANEIGPLGRGWTFTYAKRIVRSGGGILYHDGLGRTHLFAERSTKAWDSPDGFYAVLARDANRMLLRQQHGNALVFELPEAGGRLVEAHDRNGNALRFAYAASQITFTDPVGRQGTIDLDGARVLRVRDHAKRLWSFTYDNNDCLIQVLQPATEAFPSGTRVAYGYDAAHRLSSITDPNGNTFLKTTYDASGRVVRQDHGSGFIELAYEPMDAMGRTPGGRTIVRQKNGARLVLEHDVAGHVIARTMDVSSESLSERSTFNRHGEQTTCVRAAGNSWEWTYDQDNADPRARGNLLRKVHRPVPGVSSDQRELTTQYTYESKYQRRTSIVNPRGHTTRFRYDASGNLIEKILPPVTVIPVEKDRSGARKPRSVRLSEQFEWGANGQLVRAIDTRGVITEYSYQKQGYLAQSIRDPAGNDRALSTKAANLKTRFAYDDRGNVITVWDGRNNATRFEYDTLNRLVSATSPAPFEHRATMRYDANGNVVETTRTFDRFQFDVATGKTSKKTTTFRETIEYNALNNVIRRARHGDGHEIAHTLIRDAAENVVRSVQPLGGVTEYRFDERGRVIEKKRGVGTKEESSTRYSRTRNGRIASRTDGLGNVTVYDYDAFHRYRGFTDASGTTKVQSRDEAGNVTRIEVTARGVKSKIVSLAESWHSYDELNRRTRVDRAWRDPATGKPLGKSGWDGEAGRVSAIVEIGDNHLPSKVWFESGNIVTREYDGADRLVSLRDSSGDTVQIDYDASSNVVRTERAKDVITQTFDALDRVVERSRNGLAPELIAYNAVGSVTSHTSPTGLVTQFFHDAFGRRVGCSATPTDSALGKAGRKGSPLVRRIEVDDNGRVTARISESGNRTRYQYDARNRCVAIIHPDGATKHFQRDAAGNVTRIVDQNGSTIAQSFDALNRLVERRIETPNSRESASESFKYDSLSRLIGAVTGGCTIARRFDSLSRLAEETQQGRTIRYEYDASGNRTHIRYPGGKDVLRTYDAFKRVAEVRDAGAVVARYTYGGDGRLTDQTLGEILRSSVSYDAKHGSIDALLYQSLKDGRLVAGVRYAFDDAGNCSQEAQLHRGERVGERYAYDSARRLVSVQYGVADLATPSARFERETRYDLTPANTWRKRTDRSFDADLGAIEGTTDRRDAYVSLGTRRFTNDGRGNRISERDAGSQLERRYTYDYANRLTKFEQRDANGAAAVTVSYSYDCFGRQIARRVEDAKGVRQLARHPRTTMSPTPAPTGGLTRRSSLGRRSAPA